jgi:uncharacterized membrane protein YczE
MAFSLFRSNNTAKGILFNCIRAAVGLMCFGVGTYMTIQAGIGAGPWDTLNLGLSNTFGILYGTASIIVSCVIILIDALILREPIGLGMILDAIIVGKTVDLCNYLAFIPKQDNIWIGIPMMLVGLFIMGMSQYFYMAAALSCGPRDTLFVGLNKRYRKIPIGIYSLIILCIVTFIGWRLGGPVGIGTIIFALSSGPLMQLAFKIMHFDAATIQHQNLIQSLKVIFKKQ